MSTRPDLDLQRIFNAAPGKLLVLAPDSPRFTILAVTDAYLRVTKTQRSAILGRALFDVFPDHPEAPDTTAMGNTRASLERTIALRMPDTIPVQRHDLRRPEAEGGGFEERYWSPTNTPVLDEHGAVVYLIHQVEDVTESMGRKRHGVEPQTVNMALRNARRAALNLTEDAVLARRRAEETNQQLQALLQALPVGVSFSSDATCQHITGNPAVLAQFAVRPEDNLSASALDPGAPGRQVRFFQNGREITHADLPLQRAVAEGRMIAPMELEVEMPDGRRWFAEASGAPVRDAQGKVISGLAVTVDITARKQAEEALRASEERYRNVFEHAATGIAITDKARLFVQCNAAYSAMLGYSEEELRKLEFPSLIHPEDRAHNLKLIRQLTAGEIAAFDIENRYLRKDGSPLWVHKYVSVLRDRQGGPTNIVALVTDMTARKQAEEALRASEERYRGLIEVAPDAVLVLRGDLVAFANPAAASLFGVASREALRDQNLFDLLAPEDRTLTSDLIWRVEEGLKSKLAQHSVRIVRPDDSVAEAEIVGVPITFAGAPSIQIILRDRTEQNRMQRALRTSEEQLQMVLEASKMGSFEVDLRTGVGHWNATEYELLGLRPGEAPGHPDTFFRYVHPDDLDMVKAHWEAALHAGKLDTEFRVRRADGEVRWLAGKGSFVFADEQGAPAQAGTGQPRHFLGINFDITERKQAQEALQQAHARLVMAQQSAGAGIWDWDLQTGKLEWSPELFRLFGLDPERTESNFETWRAVLHPEDLAQASERLQTALQHHTRLKNEYRVLLPGGATRWIYALGDVVCDADGQARRMSGICLDITSRKQVEDALWKAWNKAERHAAEVAAIMDAVPMTIFIAHDAACQKITGNRVTSELLKLPAGTNLSKTARPEPGAPNFRLMKDGQEILPDALPVQKAARGQPVRDFEFDLLSTDGTRRTLLGDAVPLLDEEGLPRGAVGAFLDITVRKKMEEAQEFLVRCGYQDRSEDFFQALARYLAQSLSMDFVCIDRLQGGGLTAQTLAMYLDGKFEDNVAYALKDTPCGQVVGQAICCFPKEVCRLFPKDAVLQEMRAESYVGTTLWSYDNQPIGLIALISRAPLANPGLAEALLKLVAVRAAGELERTQAEAALRRARDELEMRVFERTAELQQTNESLSQEIEVRRQTEQELNAAKVRYRTVADFTYDWEYWETPEYCLEFCSLSCERITGYTAQEFIADPRLLQKIVHPEDADLWRKHRAESLAALKPSNVQFRICKKDGSIRWLEHAWQPVLAEDGRFLGIRASNRDITDRKEQEMNNQQLREELAHVTRVTTAGQLAASLAHELNQPLTAIRCNAQTAHKFLNLEPPNLAEVREMLTDMAFDSARAGEVIKRLRALFQKKTPEWAALQINDLIHETLDLLRSEFVLKQITSEVHLDPTLPPILGNRIELQQVVLNLVVNALEAMSEGGAGQRRFWISSGLEGANRIHVSLRDTGPGIQVQPISRLFEPFFTTKANGMGMGLAISHSILEAHGGDLRAVNNPDRGATFQILLPIYHQPT